MSRNCDTACRDLLATEPATATIVLARPLSRRAIAGEAEDVGPVLDVLEFVLVPTSAPRGRGE